MAFESLKIVYKQLREIHRSYKLVHFDMMFSLYVVIYLIVSFVVWALDPDVKGVSDALWFTFQTATTIGYGDMIVNNWFARVLTVMFSIYSLVLVAIFTGILAGYYVEKIKSEANDSAIEFLLDLERLPEMTHEELVDLSQRAKRFLKEE